jgi:phosphohistidine phosphatase
MQLILMRHGEAIPFARTDADRTLTPRGEAEAIEIGHQLRQARVSVVRGHSSGYRRAFQTCQLMCTETPDSALDAALKALERAVSDGDLVVFHQPLLTKVVGYLVYADPTHDVEPRAMTGTAYVLSLSDFSRGGARLIASYQPVIS